VRLRASTLVKASKATTRQAHDGLLMMKSSLTPTVFVFGIDPFKNSPSSKSLLKELYNAGFNLAKIKYAKTKEDIPDDSHVICFGADAFKALTGWEGSILECRGDLFTMDTNTTIMVFPTYSPGYVFHNPKVKDTFKYDLELFNAFIRYDLGESV
jgi:uracil-DNA glycosylase